MRDDIARFVYPVLTAGVRLREELATGASVTLDDAQNELMGLLQLVNQTQAFVDPGNATHNFLGLQYPLACWLDEMFTRPDCPLRDDWTEEILEYKLFETRHRAWKFWQQARLAGKIPEPGALETFYLCVALGFRGDLSSQDAPTDGDVKNWCADAKRQIDEARPGDAPVPVERQPATYVPPLYGERRMRTMLLVAVAVILVLVPATTFLIFNQFRY